MATLRRFLPDYPDITVEIITDNGLTIVRRVGMRRSRGRAGSLFVLWLVHPPRFIPNPLTRRLPGQSRRVTSSAMKASNRMPPSVKPLV